MRILVLGASGQVATALIPVLRRRFPAADITGTSRGTAAVPAAAWLSRQIRFEARYDNWRMLGPVDVLINTMGIFQSREEFGFECVHQGLTLLMLANRDLLGAPRIIQLSALGARPEHPVPFLSSKAKGEKLVVREANTVVLRPSIICTPNTRLIQRLRTVWRAARFTRGHIPAPGKLLNARIQPVLAHDVAELIARLCAAPAVQGAIDIVGPERLRLWQLLRMLPPSGGHPVRPHISERPLMDMLFQRIVTPCFPALLQREEYRLLCAESIGDSSGAEKILGRKLCSSTPFWRENLRFRS